MFCNSSMLKKNVHRYLGVYGNVTFFKGRFSAFEGGGGEGVKGT